MVKHLAAVVCAAGLLTAGAASADEGLQWRVCYDGLWCADVQVPADWARPADGAPLTVPLLRIPARDHCPRCPGCWSRTAMTTR